MVCCLVSWYTFYLRQGFVKQAVYTKLSQLVKLTSRIDFWLILLVNQPIQYPNFAS